MMAQADNDRRIDYIEMGVADVERAKAFYGKAFGWTTEASPFVGGYLVASTGAGDGIDGAIMGRDYQQQPTIAWLEVDDLDATLAAVANAGGAAASDPQELPGVGRLAYVRDPDGTLLGLRQTV